MNLTVTTSRHLDSRVAGRSSALRLPSMLAALSLAACSAVPTLPQSSQVKPPERYATERSFAAPVASWPQERWWQQYGDAQLDALIDEALRNSPDMAIASARLQAAEAATRVAGASIEPQLSANASVTEQKQSYNYLSPRSATPSGWHDYGRATLDFSWEIDFWGRNRAGLAAATSDAEAALAESAEAALALSSAVAADYAELGHLFEVRDAIAKAADVRTKTAVIIANRLANGLETRAALGQATARRATAEASLLQIDEQIGRQRHRLAALMGAGPDRGLAIERPVVKLAQDVGLPAELPANLLGRRPDIVAARLEVEAQARRIDQQQAEFYPNVNLMAFLGLQSLGLNMLTNSGSTVGSVGPAVSLPIFQGGRLDGALRGAHARYAEAVANYDRTLTQALRDVADAALSQNALLPQLQKEEEAVAAATDAYRVTQNRYRGGLANYLEVLSAEDVLLDAQRSLSDLSSQSFSRNVALMHALGGGYQISKN